MRKIAEINLEGDFTSDMNPNHRDAVRAIIRHGDKVGLIYVGRDSYYKIPGGGVDAGEDLMTSLHRECLEEAGVKIKNITELGHTTENRICWNQFQKSYVYLADVDGEIGRAQFTENELSKDFRIEWVSPGYALSEMKKYKPENIGDKYMAQRDLLIMEFYIKNYL